ncbi:MAG: insulinase family protein [Deltaproteobacteria bacterium]|nr:MAG: insulinase family protein [Deltaproteobacteria bacterium]
MSLILPPKTPGSRFAARKRLPVTLVSLACLLVLGIFSGAAASPGPDLFDRVVEHRLPNGLKVLLLQESRAPIISVQIWYKVGSRNEELGKTGISHLLEHLMFKATEKYGPKEFSLRVQKTGGSDNAFTGRDYTAYFENGPKIEMKNWLEMEAERMRGLKVGENDFATERNVVLEERRLRTEDDPVSFLFEEVMAAAFKAHPYQWPVIGWFHDIETLTREDFLQHYRRYYVPNNCTVVVVGDIDPQEALKAIEATFGAIPAGPAPPKVTAKEPRQYGERRVVVNREAQLPYLIMAYHAPNWEDQDAYPLELLSRVLSQGRSSRLYHNLIYQQRLALQAGADYDFDTANPTLFSLYAQPLPEKTVAQLEAALEAEVKRVQTEMVGEKELQKVKNQTVAQYYMSLDSLFFRGMILGRLETVARWSLIKEFVPKILQVTAADVQRVAKKYLVPENRNVGILSPIKTDKPKMERFTPGGQIN